MRWIGWIVALVLLAAAPAQAERRMALVVGNGAYGSLGSLPNPPADARLIAETLESVGFDVTLLMDSNQASMKRGIIDFGRRLRSSGTDTVGLFYYAGHGVQARGRNYLLPVGGNIRDEADLDIEAVEANWVLRQMESAGNRTNIVVLDACRNNPFAGNFRSVERGLARMDAPTGSFVAYATAPGGVAADGNGRNSPYTAALAKAIRDPGRPIEQVFKQVRVDVLSATSGSQTPWDSSSLTGDFYFIEGYGVASQPAGNAAEIRLWDRVRNSNDRDQIETFLAVYPNSVHANEARNIIQRLSGSSLAAAQPQVNRQDNGEERLWSRLRDSDDVARLETFILAYPNSRHIPEARRRIEQLSGTQLAAVQPQQTITTTRPAAPLGGNSVTLRISTDWSISKPICSSPGDLGTQVVSLDPNAPPKRIAARNSDASLDFEISAKQHSGGAIITLQPLTGSNTRPIEVTLGSLAPGVSETEYSNVRIPGWGRCGGVQAQVRVIE